MVEMDFSYVAGFFDGEGCVSSYALRGQQPKVKLTIGQKHREVLDAIQEFLGCGNVSVGKRRFSLQIYGRDNVRRVIRGIYPYSIVKKPQLKLAYELAGLVGESGYHGQGVSEEDHRRRVYLMEEIRRLKHIEREVMPK